jgi:hypothetical protein
MRAAPLYEERKAIVTGEKEAPAGEEGGAAPKPAEAAAAPKVAAGEPEEEEPPPGIPDFWLSAMRANPVLAEHVRPHCFALHAYSSLASLARLACNVCLMESPCRMWGGCACTEHTLLGVAPHAE